jgi:hypothetical protein
MASFCYGLLYKTTVAVRRWFAESVREAIPKELFVFLRRQTKHCFALLGV